MPEDPGSSWVNARSVAFCDEKLKQPNLKAAGEIGKAVILKFLCAFGAEGRRAGSWVSGSCLLPRNGSGTLFPDR